MYNPKSIFGYHILLMISMYKPENELLMGNLLRNVNTEAAIQNLTGNRMEILEVFHYTLDKSFFCKKICMPNKVENIPNTISYGV